jgi:glycosyltransferase involved in cell wall biosynthesis
MSGWGIFIPAYNAARHLPEVIGRIPAVLWQEIERVWIIDDGSTDATLQTAHDLCEKNDKISVHHFENNQGYGAVVRRGIAYARSLGCSAAICLHGDAQYPPELLGTLMAHMRAFSLDIVQGSRHAAGTALAGGMPVYKFIAGKILTALENGVFGLSMSDYHSGYLCYSRRAITTIRFDRLSRSFDFDLEVLATARCSGLAIGECAIPTRYADEVSYLNPFVYGLRVLRVLYRYMRGRYRQ